MRHRGRVFALGGSLPAALWLAGKRKKRKGDTGNAGRVEEGGL